MEYLVGYLDEIVRPSELIIPKIIEYGKTVGDNKLISFYIDYNELLEKFKSFPQRANILNYQLFLFMMINKLNLK